MAVLQEARRQAEGRETGLRWLTPPYEYELTRLPIDILAGSESLRAQVECRAPLGEVAASWEAPLESFRKLRSRVLLYD